MPNQHGGVRDGAGPPTAAQKAVAGAHENIRKGKQRTLSFAPIRPRVASPSVLDSPVLSNDDRAPAPRIEPTSNDPPAAAPSAWQAEVNTVTLPVGVLPSGIGLGSRKFDIMMG
jgi:hypothetical protein